MQQFRQTSPQVADVRVNPDPENIYGLLFGKPAGISGFYAGRALQDGCYVFLDHLSVGKHEIHTKGTFGPPFGYTVETTSVVCVGIRTNVFGACSR